jgi:hypothetical protein
MKHLIKLSVLLISVLLINNTIASEDITGTWQGTLVPAPGNELVIQFIITMNDDGSYSVILNSPDQGAIKDIKASSVVFDSGKLKLDVTDLSGSYEGIVKDGIIEGNWKQEGTSIPLNMKPYEKPVLSKEDMEKLVGQWHGPLKIPTGDLTLVFRFEMKEKDEYKAFLDSPDQGATGIPVSEVELVDDTLTLKISVANAEYKGKITGDEIVGEFKQGGQGIPLTLKKGEYKPEVTLSLSKEIKDKLSGEWHGQLNTPGGLIHVSFRFETMEKGDFVGFYEVPDQNVKGIPIKEAEFSDGKLSLKIKVVNAEFKGQLSDDELTGEWAQAGLSNIPLLMKKGEYVPPVFSLDLPEETKGFLSGEWHGQRKMTKGLIHVSFRFETTEKGDFLGYYEVPDQNVKEIPVTEATLSDGNLILKMQKRVNIEFKGQLAGDELTGQMIQSGMANTSVSMKKGKYIPPVYSLDLPKEIKDLLSGEWHGELKTPTATVTVVFRFETTEKGEFVGSEEVPDQKIKGIPVTEANLTDGKLTFIVTNAEFKGELAGDALTGEVIQAGSSSPPTPLTLKKGKYIPPVYSLDLPKETMETLLGKWKGKLGALTIIFRFERSKKGEFLGFLDSPDQGAEGIAFTEADLSDGKLILKVKLVNAEFNGELSKDSLEGEWIQGGMSNPLSLKKGEN